MSQTKTKTACTAISGHGNSMDQRGEGDATAPFNPLPIKCQHCRFPDLDYVAKPYLLARGITSPAELDLAVLGNFLVRERVRRILELAVPGACTFHPTADAKSKNPAPWWLAVPTRTMSALYPEPTPPFCPVCKESKDRRWDVTHAEVWERMKGYDSRGIDIFRAPEWITIGVAENSFDPSEPLRWKRRYPGLVPPSHSECWTRLTLMRELYISVRLEQLLKRAKVKGRFHRPITFDDLQPSAEDEAWIAEKMKLLAEQGLVDAPKPAAKSSTAQKWFRQFLKKNTAKGLKAPDFAAVERKHKLTLPQDYKDFILKVGSKPFMNVNGLEVTETTICLPKEMDFRHYRQGKDRRLVGEDADVDGVVFASTDFGDCYLFDVSVRGDDYPVYWYKHEDNQLEPYAPNFAECIKRFAQRN